MSDRERHDGPIGEPPSNARPLAPAPLPMLAGVVALSTAATVVLNALIANDWVLIFGFVALMFIAASTLNHFGQVRAQSEPNRLYNAYRLPVDSSTRWIRAAFITTTLIVVIGVAAITAKPGETGSALPYLLAAEFVYLVMPQLTARIAVRRSEAAR